MRLCFLSSSLLSFYFSFVSLFLCFYFPSFLPYTPKSYEPPCQKKQTLMGMGITPPSDIDLLSSRINDVNSSSGSSSSSSSKYQLKTAEEFAKQTGTSLPVGRKYLKYTELDDIVMKYPMPSKSKNVRLSDEMKILEYKNRQNLLDMLKGLLRVDPWERWTALQAMSHPFVCDDETSSIPFVPTPDPKIEERKAIASARVRVKSK